MATYPIRPVAEDELADFLTVDQHASHGTPISGRGWRPLGSGHYIRVYDLADTGTDGD